MGGSVGLGVNAAREKARVARRLGELPLIDGALRDGVVSFSKVRAMTRVATADNEAKLLGMARGATGAQLERICRGYRQVTEGRKARWDDERRYVRQRRTGAGMVRIEAQLRPDEAALVMQALGEMRGAARGGAGDVTAVTSPRSPAGEPPDVTAVTSAPPTPDPDTDPTPSTPTLRLSLSWLLEPHLPGGPSH